MDGGQIVEESARQYQNGDGQDQANNAVSHMRDYIKEKRRPVVNTIRRLSNKRSNVKTF
jgi:hypothetical protein